MNEFVNEVIFIHKGLIGSFSLKLVFDYVCKYFSEMNLTNYFDYFFEAGNGCLVKSKIVIDYELDRIELELKYFIQKPLTLCSIQVLICVFIILFALLGDRPDY